RLLRAVEVSPPEDAWAAVGAIRPVHLAVDKVQSGRHSTRETTRVHWETAHERSLAGAVEVGPLDVTGSRIRPVHLATGKIQRRPDRTDQPTDKRHLPAAVEVGPPDVPWSTEVHELGPGLSRYSEEQTENRQAAQKPFPGGTPPTGC